MLLPSITLKRHHKKGRGLFSSQFLRIGTVIWLPCHQCTYYTSEKLRRASETLFTRVEELGFRLDNGGAILPCSHACYMNHSCEANVLDFGLDFGIAIKEIHPGDEICCDYRTWNNEDWEMVCHCETEDCVRIISPKQFDDPSLQAFWSNSIRKALRQLPSIKQPLHTYLLECSFVYHGIISGHFDFLGEKNISVKMNKYTAALP